MRPQLRSSLILLAALCFLAFFLGFMSMPISRGLYFVTGVVLGVSAALFLLTRIIVHLIVKRRSLNNLVPGVDELDERSGFFTQQPAGILLLTIFLVGKLVLSFLATRGSQVSVYAILILHFILLVTLGGLYSRWAKSAEHVPILATITVVLADASLDAIKFLGNPSAQFRFGPEIVLFAASRISGRLTVLPLFIVVIWGAWKIFDATRRPAATDALLPP